LLVLVTSKARLKELSIKDVDKLIRKALKMQNPRNKYEMLQECLKLMKLLLGIEEVTVIM